MPLNRLQKIISESGLSSRRKADLLIKQGRVTLNGRRAIIGEKADPQSDQILVDGKITMPAAIEVMKITNNKTLLKVIRKEGRNRKIPRIANLLGHPVQDLQGPFSQFVCVRGRKRRVQLRLVCRRSKY